MDSGSTEWSIHYHQDGKIICYCCFYVNEWQRDFIGNYAHKVFPPLIPNSVNFNNPKCRLAAEMDVALKTLDPEQIPELVNKHVAEMDQV
jgi:hypothetical protein